MNLCTGVCPVEGGGQISVRRTFPSKFPPCKFLMVNLAGGITATTNAIRVDPYCIARFHCALLIS